MLTLVVIIILLVIVAAAIAGMYNGLVRLKNRTDEAWSDIDVQLKRRHDLIPNLVNTVKGYAAHEKEVFEHVTEARAQAISAGAGVPADKIQAENNLSGALKSLFAVAENYPQLKANENFLELQRELTDTEDKIMAARRFYNANARDLNIKIESFPTNLMAERLGFAKRDFFETEEGEKVVPDVQF